MLMEAAHGLLYLHNSDPPMLHGNLKSSNILCGTHLEIKVADFGLSCLKAHEDASSAFYLAPEVRESMYICLNMYVYIRICMI